MQIRLIRHATFVVGIGGITILIDPMFSPKETFAPTNGTINPRPNPLVDLPCTVDELVHVDAVFVTHTHRDHWDDAAAAALPKHIPIFCQPTDIQIFVKLGFTNVTGVTDYIDWNGILVTRTGGRHGSGLLRRLMGMVSGFVSAAAD